MNTLKNKIDFVVLVTAENANPNGDPLNGNMPRTTYDGYGEISDVCIKRKIRNRLQDMGESIFVQSDDNNIDGATSLNERVSRIPELKSEKDREKYSKIACEKWIDVRSFGQVFAFKEEKGSGVSVGVRGPVSIHPAFSQNTVDVVSEQITKSVSNESSDKKGSDTMGMKHRITFGLYVIKGSINVQLAEKTGFSASDALKIKEALKTLFYNDCSSARPEGSMEVKRLYWWEHNSKIGQFSSAKIHKSVVIKEKNNMPKSFNDYDITLNILEGIKPEIIDDL